MSDFAGSIGHYFSGDEKFYTEVYDKLFYGCNLPAIRGNGNLYIPKWNRNEIISIAKVMQNGMDIVETNLSEFQ